MNYSLFNNCKNCKTLLVSENTSVNSEQNLIKTVNDIATSNAPNEWTIAQTAKGIAWTTTGLVAGIDKLFFTLRPNEGKTITLLYEVTNTDLLAVYVEAQAIKQNFINFPTNVQINSYPSLSTTATTIGVHQETIKFFADPQDLLLVTVNFMLDKTSNIILYGINVK